MKVYVYRKRDKHQRYEVFNNVNEIKETNRTFILSTDKEDKIYAKIDFMISVYGY